VSHSPPSTDGDTGSWFLPVSASREVASETRVRAMSPRRSTPLRAAVVVTGLAVAVPSTPSWAGPTEAELMTEFVERFTRFTDWPPDALGDADEPFVLCVVGASPMRQPLVDLARQRTLKGRRAVVRTVDARQPEAITGCHLAFIGSGEAKALPVLLGHAEGRAVLTVADAPGFGAAGVVINFYRESRYLRFEINNAAAADSGLKLRSKLRRLGRPVGTP
jgi:hypothetical protein